jgi:hypothetical protein
VFACQRRGVGEEGEGAYFESVADYDGEYYNVMSLDVS